MNINGNFGNMPYYANQPSFPKPYPMPKVMPNIIPNFQAPKGADTINFYGSNGPDLINYYGFQPGNTYTINSFSKSPKEYTMVDVDWAKPNYPQPVYTPKVWGGRGPDCFCN